MFICAVPQVRSPHSHGSTTGRGTRSAGGVSTLTCWCPLTTPPSTCVPTWTRSTPASTRRCSCISVPGHLNRVRLRRRLGSRRCCCRGTVFWGGWLVVWGGLSLVIRLKDLLLFVYLPAWLSVCLSVCVSLFVYLCLFIYLSMSVALSMSICLTTCLSISVYLSMSV